MNHYIIFHIKFSNIDLPQRWQRDSFEEFWHDLREFMLRNNTGELEWIIRD